MSRIRQFEEIAEVIDEEDDALALRGVNYENRRIGPMSLKEQSSQRTRP